MRVRQGIVTRLLHVDGAPVVVRALQERDGAVRLRAEGQPAECRRVAIERMRFALGVDDDYRPLYDRFRSDSLLGGAIRRRPWHRPRRRPWPWEALAWAITKQLIESSRAAQIQRRMVFRWGLGRPGRTAPRCGTCRRPSAWPGAPRPSSRRRTWRRPGRWHWSARRGRWPRAGWIRAIPPATAACWRSARSVPGQSECLGFYGRGEPDSLPAGDLDYIKLVGRLAGLGRRATIAEVDEFFAPYAPYRGLAGSLILAANHKAIAAGPPLRLAA